MKISSGTEMFNCEKLKNENCTHCNQGIVQDVHVREKKSYKDV